MKSLSILGRACRLIFPCCLLVGVVMADDDSAASSDDESEEYYQLEKCILPSRIRSTDIIDDRTIVFYMSQKKIFVNQLPRRCAGLRIAGAFSYRVSVARLCDIDRITVVDSFGGRVNRGASCGLGKFRPVTEEEVAMLKNKEIPPEPQEPAPAEDADDSDVN